MRRCLPVILVVVALQAERSPRRPGRRSAAADGREARPDGGDPRPGAAARHARHAAARPGRRTRPAAARVSFVRDLPDGRRFVNDSRGFLYLLGADDQPSVYADVAAVFPHAVYNRLESGFIGFAFHPGVRRQRPASTPCTANARPATRPRRTSSRRASPPTDVTYHNVITEWRDRQPGGRHLRPARGASCCASRTSSRT